jgi:hypothetical protein
MYQKLQDLMEATDLSSRFIWRADVRVEVKDISEQEGSRATELSFWYYCLISSIRTSVYQKPQDLREATDLSSRFIWRADVRVEVKDISEQEGSRATELSFWYCCLISSIRIWVYQKPQDLREATDLSSRSIWRADVRVEVKDISEQEGSRATELSFWYCCLISSIRTSVYQKLQDLREATDLSSRPIWRADVGVEVKDLRRQEGPSVAGLSFC